ncbi:MAG: hypothetical protein JW864_17420 [Spirochaetes bacterium]|nr:hypothetical protein [Spirochaetota bacterium]
MKRFSVILSVLFVVSLMFIACNEDKTELGWINGSSGAIDEIVWADGDEEWTKDGGYDEDVQTESKEVSETTGSVECAINPGTGFEAASVNIKDVGGSTLNLSEGESYVYTIEAQPAKKSDE